MNYPSYFNKILLEDTDMGNPTHDNENNNPLASFLDDGTEEDAFDTEGIADSLKKIEDNFAKKMALLDNIGGMDKHEMFSP